MWVFWKWWIIKNGFPVPKKDENVQTSVDCTHLNRARLNDDFPLSNIDALLKILLVMLELPFMHRLSGYNQIKMVIEDREKTSFITYGGRFYYKVVPFGLKNVGATYCEQ